MADETRFLAEISENRFNSAILSRLPELALPDCHLVAGCLAQTIWNLSSGRPPEADIKDYDVFYFDNRDLSWEAEDRVIRRAAALFGHLGVEVELRNQARVHLWYERRFGVPCPKLRSSADGISRFLTPCTCVGLQPLGDGRVDLCAPFGLEELYGGVLRRNPRNDQPALYAAKVASYRARWPWLTVME